MKRNDSYTEDSRRACGSNDTINGIIVACFLAAVFGMGYHLGVFGSDGRIRDSFLEADFKSFESALILYKSNAGSFPTTEQGLNALVEKPSTAPVPLRWLQIMKKLPPDRWGTDYGYRFPGSKDPTKPEIISRGADGVANTADDLSSQDK